MPSRTQSSAVRRSAARRKQASEAREAAAAAREIEKAQRAKETLRLTAERSRTRRRSIRIAAFVIAVVLAPPTIAAATIPRLSAGPVGDPWVLQLALPEGWASMGVSHFSLQVKVEDQRDLLQETGLIPRTPTLMIWVRYSLPLSATVKPEWKVFVNEQVRDTQAFAQSAPTDNGDGTVTRGWGPDESVPPEAVTTDEWRTLSSDKRQSGDHWLVKHGLGIRLDGAPIVQRGMNEGKWTEGWSIGVAPMKSPGVEDLSAIFSVCPSCDLVEVYGETAETLDHEYFEFPLGEGGVIELRTTWRPFTATEEWLAFLATTVVGLIVAGFVTLLYRPSTRELP